MNPAFFFFFLKENLYIDNSTNWLPVKAGGVVELSSLPTHWATSGFSCTHSPLSMGITVICPGSSSGSPAWGDVEGLSPSCSPCFPVVVGSWGSLGLK